MAMRTPFARVHGLGPAKHGTGHFIAQRVTAVALVPLSIWMVASVVAFAGADFHTVRDYIAQPVPAVLAVLFLFTAFHHLKLGLQVVVEDYIAGGAWRITLLVALNFFAYGAGVASVFAVLKIAFTA
jgi:succinate dehydrogenase / fumarate reductase membrane anchor subunit